jgi:hypothetical protein
MIPEARQLEVESDRAYVVYDGKTGAIVHVHRVVTHRGATPVADEQGEARALEMARRFGPRSDRWRVLRAEQFDGRVPQRVDPKTRRLSPEKPAPAQRLATPAKATRRTGRASPRRRR